MSRLLISPLDVLKIRMQLCAARPPASLLATLRTLVRTEGVGSLWKGNWAAELMVVPYGAVAFLAYSSSKRALHSLTSPPSSSLHPLLPYVPLLSGSVSGVCATLSTYPLDLLRTRFVAQRSSAPLVYQSLRHAVQSILAADGLTGLYRGLWPTLVGIVPLMALQFHTYESAKLALLEYNKSTGSESTLSASAQTGCGFVAGVVSKWLTMPLDVIKKRWQVRHFSQAAQHSAQAAALLGGVAGQGLDGSSGGVWSMGRSIVRSEGVPGLFKGSMASLLKAGPNAALIYLVYEQCRALLSRSQQHEA